MGCLSRVDRAQLSQYLDTLMRQKLLLLAELRQVSRKTPDAEFARALQKLEQLMREVRHELAGKTT